MESTWSHPYIRLAKLVFLLLNYTPYLLFLELGAPAWIMLGAGAFLIGSMLLRHRLSNRLPMTAQLAWVLIDTLVWAAGMHLNGWDSNFVYLLLGADAAIVGWRHWRGAPYLMGVLVLTLGARALSWPGLVWFISVFSFPVVVGLLLVQAFVYMLSRMVIANAQLREQARQVEELAVLRERTRIAREVHDTVAHAFTGMIMQLEAVKLLLHDDVERAEARLDSVQAKAREGLDELRRSVHALRPLQLSEGYGTEALTKLVGDFQASTGVAVELRVDGPVRALTAAHELCLYRAVQEALSNAVRHGRARRVLVQLAYASTEVTLIVADDGTGRASASAAPGVGLTGIRERAESLGGRVAAGPASAGGFRLEVVLPAVALA